MMREPEGREPSITRRAHLSDHFRDPLREVEAIETIVRLAHDKGALVYVDDAGGARVGPAGFGQPRTLELGPLSEVERLAEEASCEVGYPAPLVREVPARRQRGGPACCCEITDKKSRGGEIRVDRQDSVGVCAATRVWNISARRSKETRGPRL